MTHRSEARADGPGDKGRLVRCPRGLSRWRGGDQRWGPPLSPPIGDDNEIEHDDDDLHLRPLWCAGKPG